MALWITASRPTTALEKSTELSIFAFSCTRTFGDSTDRSIAPPEMMQPGLTIESRAIPRRVNFAPGIWTADVQMGHSSL